MSKAWTDVYMYFFSFAIDFICVEYCSKHYRNCLCWNWSAASLYIIYKINPESVLYQKWWCLWLTWFFIGSMIISTVQFLWALMYMVVIKYMLHVAICIGIWMINCDIYSFDWKCIQCNDSLFTIHVLKGEGRHTCTHKVFAMQGCWL